MKNIERVESFFVVLKLDLIILFILVRAHEQESLLAFVHFQKKMRLEDLSVQRDTFMCLEKRLDKIFTITTVVFMAPNLLLPFGSMFFDLYIYSAVVSTYFTTLIALAISIYQSSAMQFIW